MSVTQRDTGVFQNNLSTGLPEPNGHRNRTQRVEKPPETPSPTPDHRQLSVVHDPGWSVMAGRPAGRTTFVSKPNKRRPKGRKNDLSRVARENCFKLILSKPTFRA